MEGSHYIDPLPGAGWLEKAYAYLRILSLDVVAGAVGAGAMVAKLTGTSPEWPFYLVLGLAVWVIYTLDHLLDARRMGEQASTPRHRFHHLYFRPLLAIWLSLAATCLGLAIVFLGPVGLYFGFGMAGLTLGHLLLVRWVGAKTSPFLIKEVGVTLVYCMGIWGLPVIWGEAWGEPRTVGLFLRFTLLALINLLEFSLYEKDLDAADGQTSFVLALGEKRSRWLIALLLAVFWLSVLAGAAHWDRFLGVEALMGLGLTLLLFKPDWFKNLERYRTLGDGVFLLPYLSLWGG